MVLFHLLDDEILSLYDAKQKFRGQKLTDKLEEDLYLLLAVLPAEEVVAISPTFLLENHICEEIIRKNMELVENGFLVAVMKEQIIDEFYLKKQERYKRVYKYEKYHDAYYGNRLAQIKSLYPSPIGKSVSVGQTSLSIFFDALGKRNHELALPEFQNVTGRLQETEAESFLWESVCEQLQRAGVSDQSIVSVRVLMSESYLRAYQQSGILVYDQTLCPWKPDAHCLNLLRIRMILCGLNIFGAIRMMDCKRFCALKQNGDYILAISKVFELIQSEKSVEAILSILREKKVDQELQRILHPSDFMQRRRLSEKVTDILIMVGTDKEEKAILELGTWKKERFASGEEYFTKTEKGVSFTLGRGYNMGESDAAIFAQKLIEHLKPKVITMAGFCAGREGKVILGDIVVADKVYNYDAGKQVSKDGVLPEIQNYNLNPVWRQFVERMDTGWIRKRAKAAPVDFDWQIRDVLLALPSNGDSVAVNAIYDKKKHSDWNHVIEELLKMNYIARDPKSMTLALTYDGQSYIGNYMIQNMENRAPVPGIHIGPIATGAKVQTWKEIFDYLKKTHDRKTCAVDMESHVIGKLGEVNRLPFLIAKGVGDFGDVDKSFANRFIAFACQQSYLFIENLFTSEDFKSYWNKP